MKFYLIIDVIGKEKVENQDMTMRGHSMEVHIIYMYVYERDPSFRYYFSGVDVIFLIKVSQSFFESLYSMGHKILHGMTLFITISELFKCSTFLGLKKNKIKKTDSNGCIWFSFDF